MAKLSEKALRKRDAARDIGAELLASVREMKAGKAGHVHRVPVSAITEARTRTGLSQQQFAKVLGVSTRTLQEWEQGRRQPSGAARSLLAIAARRPEVLREIIAALAANNSACGLSVEIKCAAPANGMIANPQPAKPAEKQRARETQREKKDHQEDWCHVERES